jgi:hypothetical protein
MVKPINFLNRNDVFIFDKGVYESRRGYEYSSDTSTSLARFLITSTTRGSLATQNSIGQPTNMVGNVILARSQDPESVVEVKVL